MTYQVARWPWGGLRTEYLLRRSHSYHVTLHSRLVHLAIVRRAVLKFPILVASRYRMYLVHCNDRATSHIQRKNRIHSVRNIKPVETHLQAAQASRFGRYTLVWPTFRFSARILGPWSLFLRLWSLIIWVPSQVRHAINDGREQELIASQTCFQWILFSNFNRRLPPPVGNSGEIDPQPRTYLPMLQDIRRDSATVLRVPVILPKSDTMWAV